MVELETLIENGHARRMGHVENYFGILQRQEMYKNFIVLTKFNRPVTDLGLLSHSLRTLFLKYPILACTIVDTDHSDFSKPRPIHDYIKVLDTIKLSDVILEIPEELKSLRGAELLEKLNDVEIPYANENMLWKLIILDDHTLVYLSNHCLSDGITAKYLFEDLEFEFNKYSDAIPDYASEYIINYTSDYKLMPKLPQSLDTVVTYTPPVWYFFEYLYNTFFIKFLCSVKPHYSAPPIRKDDTHSYREFKITPEELANIKATFQKIQKTQKGTKKLTLSPFIQACWLNAQYRSGFQDNGYLNFTDFSLACDARQFVPSGIDADQFRYGANTSGAHKFFRPVSNLSWSLIGYLSTYLKYLFQTKRYLFNLGIVCMDVISKRTNMDKVVLDSFVGQERTNTFFSNLGLVANDMDDTKKYQIKDVIFSQNAASLIFTFSLCTVATIDQGLNMVVTMAKNKVANEEVFDDMVQKFKENLLSSDTIPQY